VIVGERFFLILDGLLPQRSGGDRPSRTDFEREELLHIVDQFAEGWDAGLLPRRVLASSLPSASAGR
jgi:hypothetical protein